MSGLPVIRAKKAQLDRAAQSARRQGVHGDAPWSQDAEAVARTLKTSSEVGLSVEEAERRLREEGPNELNEGEKSSDWIRFLGQLKSPVVVTLIIATAISAAVGEVTDAIAIVVIVIINAVIGYLQEAKAEAAVEALKGLAAPKARVLRGSIIREIPSREVCRGDVLVFEAGDYVAADARLVAANQLSVDEAVLTGESLPTKKETSVVSVHSAMADRKNMIFAGTAIATGSGRAIVTSTAMETEVGQIAGMLRETEKDQTPLQSRLEEVSSKLLIVCLGVVAAVGVLGLFHGERWLTVLMSAISLAVAAIPEGLPAVVTLALALAIRRMAKRNAIVRHLPAVETLGSTDVICTDKTGTLTTGKMRVREVMGASASIASLAALGPDSKSEYRRLARAAVLCSNASVDEKGVSTGDPTEVALLLLEKDLFGSLSTGRRLAEWSFDSVRKRMSVAVREPEGDQVYVKGAPESILSLCSLSPEAKTKIEEGLQNLSSKGRRLLAVAEKRLIVTGDVASLKAEDAESKLEFLGVVAIADPPREESIAAIRTCKAAGIRVVMITGDHPVTARAIATELGIVEPGKFDGVLTGAELDAFKPEELQAAVRKTAVYARVSPEHKLRIVNAWKENGSVVAMTGDGVNDAPALKTASIGVSMGKGGTEVARQASSMILADDNFATIVSAVGEGRAIYGNIRRTIQYLLSGNVVEILIMLGAAIGGLPVPLYPIHLLWINLVTDGLPSLALAAEPVPEDVLETSDRPSPKNFFDRRFYGEMSFIGITIAVLALAVYVYSLKNEDEVTARTHVFSFLVFGELFRSFACRSETKTFFQMGLWSNGYHLLAVGVPISFQLLLHHTPWFERLFDVRMISWKECFVMLALTLIPVTLLELRKWWRQYAKADY